MMSPLFPDTRLITDIITYIQSNISLIIAVSVDIGRLREMARLLRESTDWQCVDVGESLSDWLHAQNLPPTPRLLRTGLRTVLETTNRKPVICNGIDLLFEPTLSLDPPGLFVQFAKTTPLVIFWPGAYSSNRLTYAVPEHAHYRVWQKSALQDARIVTLD